jgi:hypothetical protein
MNVLGIDFTSRPSRSKPITCARCHLEGDRLVVSGLDRLESLDAFSAVLRSAGPWIAGMDFPFGQPRRLLQNLGWAQSWAEYVTYVSSLSRDEFRTVLEDYKRDRPEGDREHLRLVDHLSGAKSPMKLYGVPVALMFYEGAQRLLASSCSIVPVRPTADERIVVESYPALVAHAFVGRESYKPADSGDAQTAARVVRERIVRGVACSLRSSYGLELALNDDIARICIADAQGDSLDAVLAGIQAAWAWKRRDVGYGVPCDCDPAEGWIVDPLTQPSVNSSITRVRPVFQQLFAKDPTGRSWLRQILTLTPNNTVSQRLLGSPGTLLPGLIERRAFRDRIQGDILLERAFESSVPPSGAFLQFLFKNPELLVWPVRAGQPVTFAPATQSRREALVGRAGTIAQRNAHDAAKRSLEKEGVANSSRKWWAFEGFTEVDCLLETETVVLLIEGKRTEGLSESTDWYHGRNQLHRNLEAARDLAQGREFGVLVIGEDPPRAVALGDPAKGLRHLSEKERRDLMTRYFGYLTWRQVCEATGLDYRSLPLNVTRLGRLPKTARSHSLASADA